MKLYRVTLKGMTSSSCVGTAYGVSYVVAEDTNAAYCIVREALDKDDIGFTDDRVLDKIELLAEEGIYPPCKTALYIQGEKK